MNKYKFKICWTKNGADDEIIVEGKSIEEIRNKADEELALRNIDVIKHNVWSKALLFPDQKNGH